MTLTAPAGWYVIATDAGKIGLVLHHGNGLFSLGAGNGSVTHATYVGGTELTMSDLLSQAGPQIQSALRGFGGNAKQLESFMVQADTAAGKQQTTGGGLIGLLTLGFAGGGASSNQTTQLLFNSAGNATASSGTQPVSTSPSGDVQYTGPNVDIGSVIAGIWQWLRTPAKWVRILEFVGGAVLIYIAVKGLSGIDMPGPAEVAGKIVK